MTQEEFAEKFHLELERVQQWESGQEPSQPAQILLKFIAKEPQVVMNILNS